MKENLLKKPRSTAAQQHKVLAIQGPHLKESFLNRCRQTTRACMNEAVLSLNFSATQPIEERLAIIQETAQRTTAKARKVFEENNSASILELLRDESLRIPSSYFNDRDILNSTIQFTYPVHHALAASLVSTSDDIANLSPQFFERLLNVRDGLVSGTLQCQLSDDVRRKALSFIDADFKNAFDALTPVLTSPWWCVVVQPLAATISKLLINPNPDELDELTQLVARSRDDLRLALPDGKEDWLYVLAFLPANVRFVLQPLLFFHETKKQLEKLSQTETDTKKLLLDHAQRCAAATVFTDRHFQHTLEDVASKEATQFFLIGENRTLQQELAAIIRLVGSSGEELQQFVEALFVSLAETRKAVGDRTEATFDSVPAYLYNTDSGHFLSDLYNFNLPHWRILKALSQSPLQKTLTNEGVIIVEDSQAQMEEYRDLVSQITPCSIDSEKSRFSPAPGDFLETYDPETLSNISLIILDIESPEAPYGGITLAEKLLTDLVAHWSAARDESVLVVVWSSNPKKVKEAYQALESVAEKLSKKSRKRNPHGIEILLGSYTSDPHISVCICHKGDPFRALSFFN
jgi:hypothetical protein